MEIDTLASKEYSEDIIETNLREIFQQGQYIRPKKINAFDEVRLKLSEIFENFLKRDENASIEDLLNDKFLDLDFASEYNIDASKIGVNDAIFFVNLLNQQNLISYTVEDNSISLNTIDNKKINATNSLLEMLKSSFDSKKPIRLDFDKDVTVILKLDHKGKIQAHFIPGNAEVESYLKNNISCLKQTFDNEQINYSYLGYSKYKEEKQQQNPKKQKRSNK